VVVLLDLLLDLLSCFIVSMFIYPFFYSVPFAIVFRVSLHFFFSLVTVVFLSSIKNPKHTHMRYYFFLHKSHTNI